MNTIELKSKLKKSLEYLEQELSHVRTGRASPALLENILVEAYGAKMTVKELGSIAVLDSQNLVVSAWDKTTMPAIVSAIENSDMKVNAVIDGSNIRVPIPSLTEERRKEFVKVVATILEEVKNSMRGTRQEAMKDIDREFTEKTITEDEKFSNREEAEKVVKEYVTQADDLGEAKKVDLMKI
jgi:ribosome recycling factor